MPPKPLQKHYVLFFFQKQGQFATGQTVGHNSWQLKRLQRDRIRSELHGLGHADVALHARLVGRGCVLEVLGHFSPAR